MLQKILLVGTSVRAIAQSAARAGFAPMACDLFGDADLVALCPETRQAPMDRYPECLLEMTADLPAAPVAYTGSLENRPHLVAEFSERRPLWGNCPEVLRRVRDPFQLAAAGVTMPRMSRDTNAPKARWLVKPFRSGGGLNIHPWDDHSPIPPSHYLQEQIDGIPLGGIFLGRADGSCQFLGATQQLVGIPWLGAPFPHYCGSVGPVDLGEWQPLGDLLVRNYGLRGLFGVDVIFHKSELFVLEVNPRWTASMELIEHSLGVSLFSLHAGVFDPSVTPVSFHATPGVLGKAIVYAQKDGVFAGVNTNIGLGFPEFADIPRVGSPIVQGQPVLTVFARGNDVADCLEKLQRATMGGAFVD